MTRITDERLAELEKSFQFGALNDVPGNSQRLYADTAAALRELQRLRNPPQLDWQAGFVEISQCPPES